MHRLLSCKRRITHKVYWSTGLGEISLEQRHLSTSALGKVWRELGKGDVLLLRSCLQGHTHIVPSEVSVTLAPSYFCTTLGMIWGKGVWNLRSNFFSLRFAWFGNAVTSFKSLEIGLSSISSLQNLLETLL